MASLVSKQSQKPSGNCKAIAALAVLCFSLLTCESQIPTNGLASYYGFELAGRKTASGETFNPRAFTCASWYYRFGTILRVRTSTGGIPKWTYVRVNDRGPSKRFPLRIIDLSQASFSALANTNLGLIRVTVEVVK
jgi:rare lipoprotein A